MIKILRVITRLNVGGPAQHVTFLAERLNEGMYSTALVAGTLGRGEADMSGLAVSRGVGVTYMPALGNDRSPVGDLRALLHLYLTMRSERPAVVHLHLLKARLLGGIAARLAGVPVVIETMHGHLLNGYYGAARSRAILALERFIGRRLVHAIVVLSEAQRQELLRRGIGTPDTLHVVPLGLELGRFLAARRGEGGLRREVGADDRTLLIGAVGRLVAIKGYDVFLHAVREVAGALPGRVMAVLAGDGPLRPFLEAEADRLRIRPLVRFLGWRSDVERIYADVDVFVQPSFNEGTPVAVIEAMASGTPVVACRVGGVPDVVDDESSGVLAPAGDPGALARSILRLCRDGGLRRRMGDHAREAVAARYGVDPLVRRTAALYERLLDERARRPARAWAAGK